MSVVNNLKPLLSSSALFRSQDQLDQLKSKAHPKRPNRPKDKKALKHMLKIGTGGTLDPLADGVLGEEWFL